MREPENHQSSSDRPEFQNFDSAIPEKHEFTIYCHLKQCSYRMSHAFVHRSYQSLRHKLMEGNVRHCLMWGTGQSCKRQFSTTRLCRIQSWRVATFDPNKMEERRQRIIDISKAPHVSYVIGTKNRPRFSCHLFYAIDYQPAPEVRKKVPFPEGTQGVFHYFRDVTMPPVSGGIRFRVCNSIKEFASGHDLASPTGEPWALPLVYLIKDQKWLHTLENLIASGLVAEKLASDVKRLRMTRKSIGYRPLYMPSQPFYYDLQHRLLGFHLVTRRSTDRMLLQHILYPSNFPPFTGRMKLRFEPADGKDDLTLVLRVLEILDPIEYPAGILDEITEFQVGKLVTRKIDGKIRPWTYDIKNRKQGEEWEKFVRSSRSW